MGGNALKNTNTRRYMASEYFSLADKISAKLRSVNIANHVIPAYRCKESFGDMDIVVEHHPRLRQIVQDSFNPNELIINGDVLSFDFEELQIDLISCHPDNINFSLGYFGYNDLGNLAGRLAHKLGLKFGHKNLSYVVRNNHNVLGEIVITQDFNEALKILDLDPHRYGEGFDTLEDIFNFVITSKYFLPEIYLLHNRNAISRIRDKKRKTYQEFLKFCETLPNKEYTTVDKSEYLNSMLLTDPKFKLEYTTILEREQEKNAIKAKFNGEIVSSITGLSGKALGQFMSSFSKHYDVSNMNSDDIVEAIKYYAY